MARGVPTPDERAWVEVNLTALAHNVRQFCQCLGPQTRLLAVVKADAYGHGAVTVAQGVLREGAAALGVATIGEGIELREAGITAPILVLGAIHQPDQVRAIALWGLEPTVVSLKQALLFAQVLADFSTPLSVHLKLDTGMTRLGVPWQEAVQVVQRVQELPMLHLASVYSHLATADSPDLTILQQQHQRFEWAIAQMRIAGCPIPPLHLANTAGTVVDSSLHYDWVRVGLGLYGYHAAPHLQGTLDLQPVLSVHARITQVKALAAGAGVSYGHRYVAQRDGCLAVVGIGYADGVPRQLSNQMEVLIRGRRVPQIGTVTMDQLMVDVSSIPDVEEGELVTLIGSQKGHQEGHHEGYYQTWISAEDWAEKLGTISWEVLCGFKHRLPRVAVAPPLTISTSGSR